MVAFTLESEGHEVLNADDGDVALELAKRESGINPVITDVNTSTAAADDSSASASRWKSM